MIPGVEALRSICLLDDKSRVAALGHNKCYGPASTCIHVFVCSHGLEHVVVGLVACLDHIAPSALVCIPDQVCIFPAYGRDPDLACVLAHLSCVFVAQEVRHPGVMLPPRPEMTR